MRPGAGRADNGLNRLFLQIVVNHHLDLDLGKKIHGVFTAAVELGVALLAAVAAGLENRHAFNACFQQRILHRIQLGGLETASIFSISRNSSFDSVTGRAARWPLHRPKAFCFPEHHGAVSNLQFSPANPVSSSQLAACC